jgi:hypothetical protein
MHSVHQEADCILWLTLTFVYLKLNQVYLNQEVQIYRSVFVEMNEENGIVL